MNSFEDNLPQLHIKNPGTSLLVFVLLFIAANVLSQIIGLIIGFLVSSKELAELMHLFEPPFDVDTKYVMYAAQGVSHFLGFTLFSLFFIKVVDRQSLSIYFNAKRFNSAKLVSVAILTFAFMIFNSLIIEWNMNIDFPEFMSGFEEWARTMEDQLMELTALLTQYDSFAEMLLALVIIAVLPAIGEELVFRGLLQNKLLALTKSPHIAIWIASIIFGVFHLQFYGVVPRILLGALFGYLYFYSGNIWYAIVAHFVNNGIAVIAAYIGPRVSEDWEITEMDAAVPWYISMIAFFLCIYLFRNFYNYMKMRLNG